MLKEQGAGPGHHLVELDLCRQFDVSRTPVRGALRLLADQGVVESRANRGYVLRDTVKSLPDLDRSEEHTSELQSLMRISYAVFCLKKKKNKNKKYDTTKNIAKNKSDNK